MTHRSLGVGGYGFWDHGLARGAPFARFLIWPFAFIVSRLVIVIANVLGSYDYFYSLSEGVFQGRYQFSCFRKKCGPIMVHHLIKSRKSTLTSHHWQIYSRIVDERSVGMVISFCPRRTRELRGAAAFYRVFLSDLFAVSHKWERINWGERGFTLCHSFDECSACHKS